MIMDRLVKPAYAYVPIVSRRLQKALLAFVQIGDVLYQTCANSRQMLGIVIF
jgi:hypothetical protein